MEDKHYRICPECSYFCHVNEPDQYCSICGTQLIAACVSCEQQIDNPYAHYCKHCGAQFPGRGKNPESGIPF